MRASELGQGVKWNVTGHVKFDPARFGIGRRFLDISGKGTHIRGFNRQFAGTAAGFSGFKNIAGKPVRFNFNDSFKYSPAFSRVLKALEPMQANYEQAQQRAGRRYGPIIAALEIPGEVGIVDLTAAFTALAAGDHARLTRLRRRLRAQARGGDQQAEALESYLYLLLELLHDDELRQLLLAVRALVRVLELAILADLRTAARSSVRRRPRCEQDPVRNRRCSRAPNDASSQSYPEVAA